MMVMMIAITPSVSPASRPLSMVEFPPDETAYIVATAHTSTGETRLFDPREIAEHIDHRGKILAAIAARACRREGLARGRRYWHRHLAAVRRLDDQGQVLVREVDRESRLDVPLRTLAGQAI